MATEWWIAFGVVAVVMVLWMLTLYRSIVAENEIRQHVIEGQKQAREFRKRQDEYKTSIAEEAARLDAAGILVPSVKSRLIAQGIYG